MTRPPTTTRPGRGRIAIAPTAGRPDPDRPTATAPKPWAEGRLRLRLVGPDGVGTVAIVDRPFAVIGRSPKADLPVPSPAADARHVYLHLGRPGVFAVDLATRGGTRFDDAPEGARAAWLRPGRGLELAGHRVELLEASPAAIGHAPDAGTPGDPLAEIGGLALLELIPEGEPDRTLRLLSALSFVGRSRACAVRAEGDGVARVHAVLVRTADAAFAVDLVGLGLSIDGRPAAPAAPIRDGDRLEFGRSRFVARVRPAPRAPAATALALLGTAAPPAPAGAPTGRALLADDDGPGQLLRPDEPFQQALVALVRQLYREHETLFERHMERLDRLQHEVADLREELRTRLDPPPSPSPPALASTPIEAPCPSPAPEPGRATSWLIDRLGALESEIDQEARSGWRDLLSRLGTPLRARGNA